MEKSWNVNVDGMMYNVTLRKKDLLVNGAPLHLKNYRTKTGMVQTEYEIPVGNRKALLVIQGMGGSRLFMDNRDCETGEAYIPAKVPVWAYIFVVLHCINFVNGAIGGAMAAVGILLTLTVSANTKMNIGLRIFLNIAFLILAYAIVFGLAVLIVGALY
ncbi:MAG: hypothetical protein NC489_37830 [Ruminococcus flavefaciens]|nr:hypothetical protein [Roseburia sp.]MCM1235887.1 hypothetical protein [Ruminococcus flavefaciens]